VRAKIIGRLTRVLAGRRKRSRGTRSRLVTGGSFRAAGITFRHETPDGRAIVVAFHLLRRLWQAKESGSTFHYEAPRLRDAVADAVSDNPGAPWILTLEAEVTAASGMASESLRPPSL
jgi:hypothetical protein